MNILSQFSNVLKDKIPSSKKDISEYIDSKKSQIKNIIGAGAIATAATFAPLTSADAAPTINGVETQYTYPHISLSVEYIGETKVREFMAHYGISRKQDQKFAEMVVALQKSALLKEDGILGNQTYEAFQRVKNGTQNQNTSASEVKRTTNSTNLQNNLKSIDIDEKINSSKRFIGEQEFSNFLNIFNISTVEKYIEVIGDIQAKNGLKKDFIIGPSTLEVIYNKHYRNMKNLPKTVVDRLEVYDYLKSSSYPNHRNLPLTGFFNVITNNNYWYGLNSGFNIKDTNLNERLFQNRNKLGLEPNFNNGNSIQIGKAYDNSHFIAMFVNGNLEVLSYATVGKDGNRSPQNTTQNPDFLSKSYISGSYPKRDNGPNGGAIMPYAVEVIQSQGIYIHMRMFGNNGSYGTAGCYGVPALYQKAIFDLLGQNGKQNFKIKVGQLY